MDNILTAFRLHSVIKVDQKPLLLVSYPFLAQMFFSICGICIAYLCQ